MNLKSIARLTLLATALLGAHASAAVISTLVGTPAWQPTDFHLFVAPIGAAPDYAEVLPSLQAVLPEPNHRFHPDLFIGPGDPHAGPYTHELADGLVSSGFQEKTVFGAADFTGTNGIYLAMMNVPGFGLTPPAQGSSPDFASGPIIPNSLFPIHATAVTYKNGVRLDPALELFEPPLDGSLNPPFNVDGHSHYPQFYIDSADFYGFPAEGDYVYSLEMRDAAGNGWNISAPFVVVPEPGACVLLALAGVSLGLRRRVARTSCPCQPARRIGIAALRHAPLESPLTASQRKP